MYGNLSIPRASHCAQDYTLGVSLHSLQSTRDNSRALAWIDFHLRSFDLGSKFGSPREGARTGAPRRVKSFWRLVSFCSCLNSLTYDTKFTGTIAGDSFRDSD